jgi:hypothetical protein
MQDNEKPKFFELMAGLSEIFDKSVSAVALNLYWQSLREYSLEDVTRAANNIVKSHKYSTFPKPAEFIEFINPPVGAEMKAELMTEEFYERFAESGYHSFEWQDPVLAMTVEHYGGWHSVLKEYPHNNAESAKFWMKDFKKAYVTFLSHPRKTVNLRVVGTFESGNTSKGYLTDEKGEAIPLPDREGFILIGSPEAQKYLEHNWNIKSKNCWNHKWNI